MNKMRVGIIGTGWRAEFFVRAIKNLPEQFELTNMLCRDKQRGEVIAQRLNISVVNTLEDVVAQKPDFLVLSVPRNATLQYFEKILPLNIPVLCETPPTSDTELENLWTLSQKHSSKIQIAEQYFLQPFYKAWYSAVQSGKLGIVSNMSLSALHGYHAVSIFRQFLNVGFEDVTITGKRYNFPLQQTDSRDGIVKNGEILPAQRDIVQFEFESGKVAFFDFSGTQYHSGIRTRNWNIQGERGEINDNTIRYINTDGDVITEKLSRVDRGINDNPTLSHQHISLGGKVVYQNPFLYKSMNDDEIAVASIMQGMAQYIQTGQDIYSLRNGLQDAKIAVAMENVLKTGQAIKVSDLPWNK